MDYKKLADLLVAEGDIVRVASNNAHNITLILEDVGDVGESLVLWVGNDAHVWRLSIYLPSFYCLEYALPLQEGGVAGGVWAARGGA